MPYLDRRSVRPLPTPEPEQQEDTAKKTMATLVMAQTLQDQQQEAEVVLDQEQAAVPKATAADADLDKSADTDVTAALSSPDGTSISSAAATAANQAPEYNGGSKVMKNNTSYAAADLGAHGSSPHYGEEKKFSNTPDMPPRNNSNTSNTAAAAASSSGRCTIQPRPSLDGSMQFRLSFNQQMTGSYEEAEQQTQQLQQQQGYAHAGSNRLLENRSSSLYSLDEEGGGRSSAQEQLAAAAVAASRQAAQSGLIGDSLRLHNLQQQSTVGKDKGDDNMDSPATVVTGHHQTASGLSSADASAALMPEASAAASPAAAALVAAESAALQAAYNYGLTVSAASPQPPPEGLAQLGSQQQQCYSTMEQIGMAQRAQMVYAMSPLKADDGEGVQAEGDLSAIQQPRFPQDMVGAGGVSASSATASVAESTPRSSLASLGSHSFEASTQGGSQGESSVNPSLSGVTPPAYLMAQTNKYPVRAPIVYSAIGSLESYNAQSPGSLNSRIMAATAAQQKQYNFAHTGPLLPPTTLGRNGSGGSAIRGRSGTDGSSGGAGAVASGMAKANISRDATIGTANKSSSSRLVGAETKEGRRQRQSHGERQRDKHERRSKGGDEQQQDDAKTSVEGRKAREATSTSAAPILKNEDRLKGEKKKKKKKKTVKIDDSKVQQQQQPPVEMFRPSCDAYTPRMSERKKIEYKPAEHRTPVQKMSAPMGTISRPNFRDALRRVAMIIQQHVEKINRRFETGVLKDSEDNDRNLFRRSMREAFAEENFATPRYKCTVLRLPMGRPGVVYGLRRIKVEYTVPTVEEIYEFGHQLFKSVQLSSECSIVCLIYVERLMEVAKVPLLPDTWRPIFMCGLLLASKVWQDLSSWNIEFASVYPQFSLESINRLELQFLKNVRWDLYISSSLYAKYYFALRSLLEKQGFRRRYNLMTGAGGVAASEALKIQKRTERVKEEALQQLSRSM